MRHSSEMRVLVSEAVVFTNDKGVEKLLLK